MPKKNKKQEPEEKQNPTEKPKVHPELEGFDVKINSFGEITTNFSIDKINEFLNKNVVDKKLKHLDGYKKEADDNQDSEI